ncbi:MAG: DUF11 domain-containing protein [Lewinellaceae bacterium]|nr:DUF11 domain-containing protein [Lewinellaceae bacterium]
MPVVCLAKAIRLYAYAIAATLTMIIPQLSHGQCTPKAESVSGFVYEDVNNDGIKAVDESGIANVQVAAFNGSGQQIGSALTLADGSYIIENLTDGSKVRLVFTYLSSYYSSMVGKDNGTSVQFHQVPVCDASLGLFQSQNNCGLTSEVVATCFVQGDISVHPNEPTIVAFEYGFNSTSPVRKFAMQSQTGSIWGLAWKQRTRELFSSAFVKQYAGLTSYGHDAIFKSKEVNGMYTTNFFIKLSDLGQDVGTLAVTDVSDCLYGSQVGKIGLGALVISEDENDLYTVNLYNNTLVKLSSFQPKPETTKAYQIPDPGCSNGSYHAFALKMYAGKLYVGVTCTGEVSKSENDSEAIVYEFDPSTEQFTEIFSTNKIRGYWYDSPASGLVSSGWLTDIDFTDQGNMLLSLSDRIGHRYCKATTNRLDEQRPDLLMVWNNNGVWTLESNGTAGSLTGTGVGNGQGPDGGEFFGDDYWIAKPTYHAEIAIGSIYAMPGTNSVIAAVFDPEMNAYSGGMHRYNTTTGEKEGSLELYTQNITEVFGKATGFGEIIGVCGLNDLQIGNFVWFDDNQNGYQDAGENGVVGLTLNLLDENCTVVGTTITDASGNYLFDNSNVLDGLQSGKTYFVQVDPSIYVDNTLSINGASYTFTTLRDNYLIDNNPFSDNNCTSNLIAVTPQSVDHTIDIGLRLAGECALAVSQTLLNEVILRDDIVNIDVEVVNKGVANILGFTIQNATSKGIIFDPLLNPDWVVDGDNITYTHTGDFLAGQKVNLEVHLRFDPKAAVYDFENTIEFVSLIDASGEEIENIEICFDNISDSESVLRLPICDLALMHYPKTNDLINAGSPVTLVTQVCNQGTQDAEAFDISNYILPTLLFDPKANTSWTLSDDGNTVVYHEEKPLAAGECREYELTYVVTDITGSSGITNYAEISSFACNGDKGSSDFDSTPDADVSNDLGGKVGTPTDNMMDDHGDIDEDDHDPALIRVGQIEVGILKTAKSRSANAGDLVEYNITFNNLGTEPVTKVVIMDYIPEVMTLEDPNWTEIDGVAYRTVEFPGDLAPGQSHTISIFLRIDANVRHPYTIYNTAELKEIFDQYNREIITTTTDDNSKDDDSNNISTAYVVLICPAEFEPCSSCRSATTPYNGQFELFLKIASAVDEGWYVESSTGLYDFASPLPPAAPIPLANGYVLTEFAHPHPGHSYYLLEAVHLDGKGFAVTFRNKYGDIQQVNVPGTTCSFEKVTVSGPQSLCIDGEATYTATSVSGTSYTWTIDDVEVVGETTSSLTVDWTGYSTGAHIITVNSDNECSAPAILTVMLGAPDGASIACIGDFNVSLDGNCTMEITPQMMVAGTLNPTSPYSVMLTDASGNVIGGNILTREYIGKTVMAKLIEGCGGNSCWSSITVADKTPPVSVCQPNISIPCYFLDNYKGPFETDNCGGDVVNILINEQITALSCDPKLIKYINRSYQATDQYGNKSAVCNMRIDVTRPDLSIIAWPEDHIMVNDNPLVCTQFTEDDFGRPVVEETGVPTIAGLDMYPYLDELCNVYTTYVDSEVKIGCVRKIVREWLVYEEHCDTRDFIRHKQYIDIVDTTTPTFADIDDVTISVSGHGLCQAKFTLPVPVVTDACGNVAYVTATYPGGFVDHVVAGTQIDLPVGDNIITYVAYDDCKNSSQYSFNVYVHDKTAPVMICKGATVAGINSQGEAYIYPKNIDDGTFDNCSLDSLHVARMDRPIVYSDYVVFDCSDVGETFMVGLRAKDASGNENFCMVNVTIQDKHFPSITCPANATISCDEVHQDLDLSPFGEPIVTDACATEYSELDPVFDLNSCREGEIYRTFVGTDGTNEVTCTQVISVISYDRFDPAVDVVKSIDFTVTDGCSVDDLKPENFDDLRGYPIITQSDCGLAAASYKDEVFNFVTGACFKILRTWTVIDWCEMNRLGSDYQPYKFQQVIKVVNSIAPVFDNPVLDVVALTEPGVCDYADVTLSASASDVCTPDNKLRWTYKIDFDNNGTFDVTNSGLGASKSFTAEFPVGTHRVLWSFEDGCGNVTSDDQLVFVHNNDNPKASCLQQISVSLSPMDINGDGIPDTEMGCIRASTLNASSFHPCGHDITFAFSHDPIDTLKCFDCFDKGQVEIDWYVIDIFGHYDICKVIVDVQDNNDSDVCERICLDNPVVATLEGDSDICLGESSVLTVVGGVKYHWNTGESTPSITVHPTSTTTYSVTVSNEVRCTAVLEFEVTVHQAPIVTVSGNKTICVGSSTTLTAAGGASYVWSNGGTTASITVSPTQNTTYTVTATDVNGCTGTTSATVTINPQPNVLISGSNVICINETTPLTASGAQTYIWSTGETTQTIFVSPSTSTVYSVTGTDSNGCVASDSHTVDVNGLTINIQITGDDEICLGSSSTLTASGGIAYEWSTGETTTSITVAPIAETTYTVTGTDANGCSSVAQFTVDINPLPVGVISGDLNICPNTSTVLTAAGGTSYIWSTGATTTSITVSPVVDSTFFVTVTDGNGCQSSTSATVFINTPPVVTITGDDEVCLGNPAILFSSIAQSYLWSTGETTQQIIVTPADTTTYTVTITDDEGCFNSGSYTVNVLPLPIVNISGDDMICLGESDTLVVTGGSAYLWNTGETNDTIYVTPDTTTVYFVTVTDINACVNTGSYQVFVDPGTLTCTTQDITVYLDDSGAVMIEPQDISTGSAGACADITADVNPDQFFCNQIGQQIVTLTVTNTISGSSLTCTAVVTIQDTIPPTLLCPSDLTFNCDQYDPNIPLSTYGSPFFDDNCPNGLGINEFDIVDVNGCGIGQITRTFVASDISGNSESCVQLITFINPDPLLEADITFPPDVTVSNCADFDPSILGQATVATNASPCSDIQISYTDDLPTGPICGGVFNRVWTVQDNCAEIIGGGVLTFTHTQVITVTVEIPVITGPADTILYLDPAIDCNYASLDGSFHTANGCNLELYNDFNNTDDFNVTGQYPEGTTTVTLSATEPCTNTIVSFAFTVEVIDNNAPVVTCVKLHPLINDNLEAYEYSSQHGSIGNSCADIVTSFSNTDINDTLVTSYCSDVGVARQLHVYFWYVGASAPFEQCTTASITMDPNHYCPIIRPSITGGVVTEAGIKVPEVAVQLIGSSMPEQVTGIDGNFAFEDMDFGGSYTVLPGRDNKYLEGVSTLDLIYIQKHILGAPYLNSPFKIIAADVNNDKKITVSDISELRKMLLGIYQKFPRNTSWRMVDQHYTFPDVTNPFIGVFDERCNIDPFDESINVLFTGVKVGDVNDSYSPDGVQSNKLSSRNAPYIFESEITQDFGSDYTTEIIAGQNSKIAGFQISISLPTASAVTIKPAALELDESHYHFENGILRIVYDGKQAISVKNGDVLFEIVVLNSSSKDRSLSLHQSMHPEIYDAELTTHAIELRQRNAELGTMTYLNTQPNPWSEKTSVVVSLPTTGQVHLTLRDVTGRLVFSRDYSVAAGINKLEVTKEQLPQRGLFIGELLFNGQVETFKMLLIE